mmetsp:Transcript_26554/g.72078  ORF Transcript_26554/g.72078 Transcript_26554/m.72078 type:complete len:221 (-) Transcript_26554:380-1042(-)
MVCHGSRDIERRGPRLGVHRRDLASLHGDGWQRASDSSARAVGHHVGAGRQSCHAALSGGLENRFQRGLALRNSACKGAPGGSRVLPRQLCPGVLALVGLEENAVIPTAGAGARPCARQPERHRLRHRRQPPQRHVQGQAHLRHDRHRRRLLAEHERRRTQGQLQGEPHKRRRRPGGPAGYQGPHVRGPLQGVARQRRVPVADAELARVLGREGHRAQWV